MFARVIDDFRRSTGSALRLTSLAAAAALALLVTISFLCAAGFVFVFETYGLMQACLAGAAVFFIVTLIAAGCYTARARRIEKERKARAAEAARSAMHSALADPMLLTVGLQVIRAIGIKKLLPILAVGGIALGFLASRNAAASDETPAE